jgi:WD40 repeat protein
VSEIDPMFPSVEAVRMDVRFGMKSRVEEFKWKTPSSMTLPPVVAVATSAKEYMIVKILGCVVKCATRGSALREIVTWSIPFDKDREKEEKHHTALLRWCPESDTIAVAIDCIVWILSTTLTTTIRDCDDLKLCGHGGIVSDISWFPRSEKGDHLLLTTSLDRTAQIWHVETRTSLRNLRGHTGSLYFGAWLNETFVVTGSSDHSVRLWNVNESPYEVPPARTASKKTKEVGEDETGSKEEIESCDVSE